MNKAACYSTDPEFLIDGTLSEPCDRRYCDTTMVDFVSHGLLLIAWFIIGLAFCIYAGVGRELVQSTEETHSYENQATGLVAKHRKHTLFGRSVIDPRRYFIMAAMWCELPGFALVPLSLALSEQQGKSSPAVYRSSFDSLQV